MAVHRPLRASATELISSSGHERRAFRLRRSRRTVVIGDAVHSVGAWGWEDGAMTRDPANEAGSTCGLLMFWCAFLVLQFDRLPT